MEVRRRKRINTHKESRKKKPKTMTFGTDRRILGLRRASIYTLLNMQPECAAASSQLRAAPRRYFHMRLPGSIKVFHWNLKRKWLTAWWTSKAPPHESLATCVYALWGAIPTCQPTRELHTEWIIESPWLHEMQNIDYSKAMFSPTKAPHSLLVWSALLPLPKLGKLAMYRNQL